VLYGAKRLYDDRIKQKEALERRRRDIELYGDHQVTAAPSAAEMARREQQRRQGVANIEMVLAGPFAVAGIGVAAAPLLGGATTTAAAGGAATMVTTGNAISTGGRVIYTAGRIAGNPTIQRIAVGTAANAAVYQAAASSRSDPFVTQNTSGYDDPIYSFLTNNSNTYELFYYWPDAMTAYQPSSNINFLNRNSK